VGPLPKNKALVAKSAGAFFMGLAHNLHTALERSLLCYPVFMAQSENLWAMRKFLSI
jgi:hypothetical protein